MFDLVFRGGSVVDGSGRPRFSADVALQGDRIVAVGQISADAARRSLDVTGLVVAPGFIDVHNHSDGWLLKYPNFASKTLQGVTTEVLMSDGISYAPTSTADAPHWIQYLRGLNGLQLADYKGWHTFEEYYQLLDRRTAQNVVAQIPYANLRVSASGWSRRSIDDIQTKMMQTMVESCMESGAVGISTGMDYINQWYSPTDELVEVLSAMRPWNALYVTHVRYKKGLLPAMREAVDIARRSGAKLHVSHLKSDNERTIHEVLEYIDTEATREVDFSFDVYPYLPGSTMLHALLPYDIWDDGPMRTAAKLADPEVRRQFALALDASERAAIDHIRLAWTGTKANAPYLGLTLAEYIEAVGKPAADALCDLLMEENLAILGVFHNGDDALVEPFIKHDKFMFGSDGIFQPDGPVHPRQFGAAARLVGPIVRDRRRLTLEEAVRKLTPVSAARFGLVDRGLVREGAFADLVVFDPATIADRATFTEPRQTAVGVHHVVVNGTPIVADGKTIDEMTAWPGRWLKYHR